MHRLSSWLHLPINRRSSNKGAKEVNMPISTERPPPPPFKGKNNRPIAREITNHLPSSVNKNETKMQKQLVRKISLANKSANVDENKTKNKQNQYQGRENHGESINFLTSSSNSSSIYSCQKQVIRTNPWIVRKCSNSTSSSSNGRKDVRNAERRPTETRGRPIQMYSDELRKLEDSICSSGYGTGGHTTADCSPECSIHSPDWQQVKAIGGCSNNTSFQSFTSVLSNGSVQNNSTATHQHAEKTNVARRSIYSWEHKNVERDHIYHELEPLNRLSLLELEDDQSNSDLELSNESEYEHRFPVGNESNVDSIYAVPYAYPQQQTRKTVGESVHYELPSQLQNSSLNQIHKIQGQNMHAVPPKVATKVVSSSARPPVGKPSISNQKPRTKARKRVPKSERNRFEYTSSSDEEFSSTSCDSWMPLRRKDQVHPSPLKQASAYGLVLSKKTNADRTIRSFQGPMDRPNDILARLDEQIAELQIQSNAVRELVARTKRKRGETRKLCMDHLGEIQKMGHLSTAHSFELYL